MNLNHTAVTIDINSRNEQRVSGIVNVNDKKTRYIDVTVISNGEVLLLSECTATAAFVIEDVLINNAVDCTINNNVITIPLEEFNARSGLLSIELSIKKGDAEVLNTPLPIKIRVTKSIADNAVIDNRTYGSIADTVREVNAARGDSTSLSARLIKINADISTAKAEAISAADTLLDEYDEAVTTKINLKADKESVDSAFAALNKTVSDNKTETDTALDGKADKATTLAGYGITDAYTKTLSDRMYSCQISIAFDENNIPLTFVSNSRLMSAHFSAVSEKIRYVYISSHVDMVDSDAFSGCTKLYAVYYGVNDNDRIDNFSAIIRSALPNNPITFANTSRREISDFLIKSIKSLSEIKYDSSNVENGSGTLSPATSTDTGCEGNFIYSKNGNTVTVTVNMTKFLAGKNYVRMSGLPFKQNLSIRLASLLARASSDDYVNVRIDGSWLYFTKSNSSFADDETLIVTVTYII